MSRFYNIVVGAETAAAPPATAPSNNAGATWTNLVNGRADLGAQTVELDVTATTFDAFNTQAYVRIWGPAKQQILQASDFNGAPIQVFAGMQAGLPLATSQVGQQGLILKGKIFQAFANWQGINQSLDFVCSTDGGDTQSNPGNIQFYCQKGQAVGPAIQLALQIAYPQYKINIAVKNSLILTQDEHNVSQTLQQFASYIKGLTQPIIGGLYQGVSISLANDTLNIFDEAIGTPTPITIQDLVGQVTWLDAGTISFSTVLRADLSVSSLVSFPELVGAQAVTTRDSNAIGRAKNTFSGTWTISYMRHVGNSRAPDAQSWVTVFQAFSNTASPFATSPADSSA